MMAERRVVTVKSIYGWSWTDGVRTIDTPAPFSALTEREGDVLTGEIQGEPFHGARLRLSKRHVRWDGCVNSRSNFRMVDAFVAMAKS